MPIKTYGLTHLALTVQDPEASLRFYRRVFGVRECYRDATSIQVFGPGRHDVIAFEKGRRSHRARGGIQHFGFRLRTPRDIDAAIRAVRRAGGAIVERGEFVPGEPYVFVRDPDGYLVEIWYE